jgi:ABC-2 type transport system ATP-binding protein
VSKVQQLGGTLQGQQIYVRESDELYQILDVLKPLPFVRIYRDQANLTDIFLKLVREKTLD